MESDERYRLVVLGGKGVGKTAIIKRFLFGTFVDKHRKTVEDLYCKQCHLNGGGKVDLDVLDTAGELQFPAMRRLRLANADAFLLVYAVDDAASLERLQCIFQEIREVRADLEDLPVVVAGNKLDCEIARQVSKDSVCEWVYTQLPNLRFRIVECSAKENRGVREVFGSFLYLARLTNSRLLPGVSPKKSCSFRSRQEPEVAQPPPLASGCKPAGFFRNGLRSRSLVRSSARRTSQSAAAAAATDECRVS